MSSGSILRFASILVGVVLYALRDVVGKLIQYGLRNGSPPEAAREAIRVTGNIVAAVFILVGFVIAIVAFRES